jgi:hypothetical protein
MVRDNPNGTQTPLTMPNHAHIKGSTLRTICTQSVFRALIFEGLSSELSRTRKMEVSGGICGRDVQI